ncbi:hypothetical protein [Foetidibacter luteolus]|uniref:hypothetical protein n=1 Tax=Foetidibacter luteolus TaxID=2608880 RepID=UPI00129A83B9|nr:hypothetical protein [Foetidibacter luteolus]
MQNVFNYRAALSIFFLSILFSLLAYNPFGIYFLNDDFVHITLTKNGNFLQHNSLRIVHEVLLKLELFLWGKHPAGYHFDRLLIHLFCCWLVYRVGRTLFNLYGNFDRQACHIAGVLSASFFAVYPFHSEAVLWVLGGGASLSTLFFLVSLLAYLQRHQGYFWFFSSVIAFLFGLFTYESVWISPLIIATISYLEIRKNKSTFRAELFFVVVYVSVFFAYLIIRVYLLGEIINQYEAGGFARFPFQSWVLNYNRLLARSFLPPLGSTIGFVTAYCIVFGAFLGWGVFILKTKKHTTLFFLVLSAWLIALLPFVGLGIDTHDTESERFLYLPSVFFSFFSALFIVHLRCRLWIKTFFAGLFILGSVGFLYKNSRDYRVASVVSESLLRDVSVTLKPGQPVCIQNLPKQLNGVKIFHLGFKEGLGWLYHADTARVTVLHSFDLAPTEKYYKQFPRYNYVFKASVSIKPVNEIPKYITVHYDTSIFKP